MSFARYTYMWALGVLAIVVLGVYGHVQSYVYPKAAAHTANTCVPNAAQSVKSNPHRTLFISCGGFLL